MLVSRIRGELTSECAAPQSTLTAHRNESLRQRCTKNIITKCEPYGTYGFYKTTMDFVVFQELKSRFADVWPKRTS